MDEFRGTLTVELKRANSGAAEPKKKSKPSGFKNPLRAKSKKSQDTSEESLLNPGLDNSYQTYSFHLKILKEEQVQIKLCLVSPLQLSKLLKYLE